MTQKDRKKERGQTPPLPIPSFPLFSPATLKNARGPLLIIAEENKVHFQKGFGEL